MPDWDKIFEWLSIFIIGLGVVFTCGKNKQAQIENRKHIDNLNNNMFPDDDERKIIRQADINREWAQFERLVAVMEKNLIQTIKIEIQKKF